MTIITGEGGLHDEEDLLMGAKDYDMWLDGAFVRCTTLDVSRVEPFAEFRVAHVVWIEMGKSERVVWSRTLEHDDLDAARAALRNLRSTEIAQLADR